MQLAILIAAGGIGAAIAIAAISPFDDLPQSSELQAGSEPSAVLAPATEEAHEPDEGANDANPDSWNGGEDTFK